MKKLLVLLSVLFAGTMLFAASSDTYVVEEIVGNATYEVAPGQFDKIAIGQELKASTVINTGLNSSVVLVSNGKKITIKAKQKGTVESLFLAAASTKGGLKMQSIAKASAEDSATGKREGVSTASSRASEAKEDFAWEE